MNVLVVYYQVNKAERNTVFEHLYSFDRYSEHNVSYLNAFSGIPPYIGWLPFDVVIFHYTFLAQKLNGRSFFRNFLVKCKRLKDIEALKVAMPQDEYVNSDLLCEFFKEFGVDVLFTCFYQEEWEKVYPKAETNLKHYFTTLTGYVDDLAAENAKGLYKEHRDRKFDIGYRARKLPFWLGEHATIKWRLTEIFQEVTENSGLNCDLSNDERKVLLGNDWGLFLSNCRTVLGCEGGASLLDVDGKIRQRVEAYLERHPQAKFEEVKEACFHGLDYNIKLFAISPRHFEACMTKTTQILMEGDYFGIFIPNVHYIEIKRDWSNVQDVLEKIRDKNYCEQIAENAYRDVILSGKYTFSVFVKKFFDTIESLIERRSDWKRVNAIQEKIGWFAFYVYPVLFGCLSRPWYRVKVVVYQVLKGLGLVPLYRRLRARYLHWEL